MLRTLGKLLAIVLGLGLLGLVAVAYLARYHDGPLGPFPGGAFGAESEAAGPGDWGELAGASTVELEVGRDSPRSVTTWVVVHDGVVFIPSGMAARKTWPGIAASEGRLRLRVGDRVFERSAERVRDPAQIEQLNAALQQKYGVEGVGEPGDTWWFRLGDPAAPASG